MVAVNGVPPIGFTRVAVIAETQDGVRMAYMLDPSQPVTISLEPTYVESRDPWAYRAVPGPTVITVQGTSIGMNIWQGPMPGDPPAQIERAHLEVTS